MGIVMLDISFIALDQSPIVSDPIEASLDLASMAVAGASADRSSTLGSTHERRNRRFDAPPVRKLEEVSDVIGLVRDQIPKPYTRVTSLLWYLDCRQCWLGQHAFTRLCAIYLQSSGQATAVDNSHTFGAFAHFGFANTKVPFCVGTKRPSTQACAHLTLSWAFNRPTTPAKYAHVPGLDQEQKRRQQVAGEPSTCGTFSRAHLVLHTQRMPLSIVQSSFRFRPGPGCCWGSKALLRPMVRQWRHVGSCPQFNVSRANSEMTCRNRPNGRLPRPLVGLRIGQCRGKQEGE
jgi:hypothetical protein